MKPEEKMYNTNDLESLGFEGSPLFSEPLKKFSKPLSLSLDMHPTLSSPLKYKSKKSIFERIDFYPKNNIGDLDNGIDFRELRKDIERRTIKK